MDVCISSFVLGVLESALLTLSREASLFSGPLDFPNRMFVYVRYFILPSLHSSSHFSFFFFSSPYPFGWFSRLETTSPLLSRLTVLC
ncbi:hypothetical protein BDW74DRAFT_93607 [Aspergillus multicolor]|uniref:uncharacterized protein n=1 Tax=Aspergillus multicolor TaxID=41759 RepID=UPI003CCE2B4C